MAKDQKQWQAVFEKLKNALRHAAQVCYDNNEIDERVRDKYFVSGERFRHR